MYQTSTSHTIIPAPYLTHHSFIISLIPHPNLITPPPYPNKIQSIKLPHPSHFHIMIPQPFTCFTHGCILCLSPVSPMAVYRVSVAVVVRLPHSCSTLFQFEHRRNQLFWLTSASQQERYVCVKKTAVKKLDITSKINAG